MKKFIILSQKRMDFLEMKLMKVIQKLNILILKVVKVLEKVLKINNNIYILDKLQFVALKSLILNINNISKKTNFGNCIIKNLIGHIRTFKTSY